MRRHLSSMLFWHFCSQKLTKPALQAVLAEATFKEIKQAPNKNLGNKTLADHLSKFELPSELIQKIKKFGNNDQEIDEARKQMIKIFDPFEGAKIHHEVAALQRRFKDGKNKKDLFPFYPNTFVTSVVFENISKYFLDKDKLLLVGKQGISKSVGFLLAWHLSSIVTEYRYHNVPTVQKLVKEELLLPSFCKIIYINFSMEEITYSKIIKLVEAQCPEIKESFDNFWQKNGKDEITGNKFKDFLTTLQNAYDKRNIKVLIVMDQINTLARLFHECNQIKKKKNSGEVLTKDESDTIQQIETYQHIYLTLLRKFDVFLNSSRNIEERLLELPGPAVHLYFTLRLKDHFGFKKIQCGYNVKGDEAYRKELCRFMWYESTKFIKEEDKRVLEEHFKAACDEFARRKGELGFFMTPLAIRLAVQSQKQQIQSLLKENRMLSQFIKGEVELEKRGLEKDSKKREDRIIKFAKDMFGIESKKSEPQNNSKQEAGITTKCAEEKPENSIKQFLEQMSSVLKSQRSQPNSEALAENTLKFSLMNRKIRGGIDNFLLKLYQKIGTSYLQLEKEKFEKYLNKEADPQIFGIKLNLALICAKYFEEHELSESWDKIPIQQFQNFELEKYYNKDLYQLTKEYLVAKVSKIQLRGFSTSWIISSYGFPGDKEILSNPAVTGSMIEILLLNWFELNPKSYLKISKHTFPIGGLVPFQHFLTQNQKTRFWQSTQNLFKAAKQLTNLGQFCLGLPIILKDPKQLALPLNSNSSGLRRSPNNPVVDFMIVRYVDNAYEIFSFDLTVKKSSVSNKMQNAANLIPDLIEHYNEGSTEDETGLEIKKWNHAVLCLEEHTQGIKVPPPTTQHQTLISFQLLDITSLQVFYVEDNRKGATQRGRLKNILEKLAERSVAIKAQRVKGKKD